MAHTYEIPIELVSQQRIDATVHGHLIRTDQPIGRGGHDAAPSPFDLFLASIGTCAGLSIQTFCVKRDIPFQGIGIIEEIALDDHGVLTGVEVRITLPEGFPPRYVTALHKVVAQCAVARSVLARPNFTVTTHKSDA
ncbi:MAG: OsmC family protein [Myxococcota bacterium]